MKFFALKGKLPSLSNSLSAILSAIFLILAFPGFEFTLLTFFALVPLFIAVEREKKSSVKAFVLGWIFGTTFFFGSCWWLTHAPVTYVSVPAPFAYALLFLAVSVVGLFPAIFGAVFALFLRRFGALGILSAPFLWTAIEFLRFWATGNNWNAIGYSQAFVGSNLVQRASIGGIYLTGFYILLWNLFLLVIYEFIKHRGKFKNWTLTHTQTGWAAAIFLAAISSSFLADIYESTTDKPRFLENAEKSFIVAVQPNVPMSGLKYEDRLHLRDRHVEMAEEALQNVKRQMTKGAEHKTIVIFPESPMNFTYAHDLEFQEVLREFTARNNVSVLFNAAEPANAPNGLYNSAVLVDERGEKISQYNKIHLVPFGEYVPLPEPLASVVPSMVGNFEIGDDYNLMPFGDARAGIMICFESHFPNLTRRFAADGADVLVELTNDGYLGNTPVLRQHLANAVFRAVETNRPVVRVTNTGITAFIDESGKIHDATEPYREEVRVWTVKKSDGKPTFYVKYGDWFAWLCASVSLGLLILSFMKINLPQRRR